MDSVNFLTFSSLSVLLSLTKRRKRKGLSRVRRKEERIFM